jgi:twitching motility protein PilT
MAKIDAFFKLMNVQGASDLHLTSGQPPALRIRGEIERVKYKVLDNDDLRSMLYEIAPEQKIKHFEETGDIDFGYEIPGLARYRANFFMQKNGVGAVFREIPSAIMTADQLGLPEVVSKLATLPRGLVLVTGPTGSGKSTTLAAIVDVANRVRKDHIITVEDPIEFVHQSQGCIVNHREVGIHTNSFSTALRGALREDPDVILVGEMRDLETISLAVEAASTGHLVFSTLHTSSAYKTVDRVIEVFPSSEQPLIRSTLSDGLRAVIAQTLFKRIDRKGRVVTHQIPSMIQTGKKYGMILLDDSIMDLYSKGMVSAEEAYAKANEKGRFRPLLKAPPPDFTEA